MPWGAIIGAGVSLLGGMSANKQAKKDSAEAARANRAQEQMQREQMQFAYTERDDRNRELDYQRQIEAMNRELAGEDYTFQRGQLEQYREQILTERQYGIDRQVQLDRDAAEQRAFQIEQMLQNQSISAAEREQAMSELQEAQATASGERDEDLRRFAEEREMLSAERDFRMQQFEGARDQSMSERDTDLGYRDAITGRIDDLRGTLTDAQRRLGDMPAMPTLSAADIENEVGRRSQLYRADADRAVDRIASVTEARLMRNGMDASTQGNARRGDIAREASDMYATADNRAYDDALAYITGKTGAQVDNVNAQINRRGSYLDEYSGIGMAGIEALLANPRAASAVDAYQLANMVGSGVNNRGIASANDYNAPMAVGSSIYDRIAVGDNLGQTMNLGSAASGAGINLGHNLISPYGTPNYNPAAYAGSAASLASGVASNANSRAAGSNAAAGAAGSAMGSAFADLFNSGGGGSNSRGMSRTGGTAFDGGGGIGTKVGQGGQSLGGFASNLAGSLGGLFGSKG